MDIGLGLGLKQKPLGFSPLDVPNLLAWYDASKVSTLWQDEARTTPVSADGQAVGAWDDRSGNGNHLLQANADNRLTYKTGIINGRSVLRADGIDDFMDGISIAQSLPMHVYAVVDTTRLGDGYRVFLNRSVTSPPYPPAAYLGSTGNNYKPTSYWNGIIAAWGSAVQRLQLIRWRWRTDTPFAAVRVDDGEQEGAPSGTSVVTAWTQLLGGAITPADIDICELIIMGDLVGDDDLRLASYLNRWSVY